MKKLNNTSGINSTSMTFGLWGLIAACILANTWIFISFTVDDAWITFRYGLNLVNSGIWNYNPTLDGKVEGYTNALYAFLSILPHWLSMPVTWFFKLISIVILFVFLVNSKSNGKFNILPLVFIATSPLFFVHLFSGLETAAFMLLIFICAKEGHHIFRNTQLCFVVALLFPLVRPEGAIYSAVLGFYALFIQRNQAFYRNRAFIAMIAAGMLYLVYFTIRYLYFDSLFPNPFYVKTANKYSLEVARAIKISWIYWFPTLILAILLKSRSIIIWLSTSMVIWVFLYHPSELQMNYADRFLFQIFFPVLLAALSCTSFTIRDVNGRVKAAMMVVLCALSLFLLKYYSKVEELGFLVKYNSSSLISHKALAKMLDDQGGVKILMGDAGIFSYFSTKNIVIDMVGLANKEIAKEGLSTKMLEREKPDVILLYATEKSIDAIPRAYNQFVALDYINASEKYNQVTYIRCLDGNYLASFVVKDHPNLENLTKALMEHEKLNDSYKFDTKELLLLHYL